MLKCTNFLYLSKLYKYLNITSMPQLDLMTFSTQFFWFSLCFTLFYILILHYILIPLSVNIKYRKKKLNILVNTINKKKSEFSVLHNMYDKLIFNVLNFSKSYIIKTINYSISWLTLSLLKINIYNFVKPNNIYIKVIYSKNFYSFIFDTIIKRI